MLFLQPATILALSIGSFVGSQSINPSDVDPSTRDTWCTNQEASCPLLCTQEAGSTATSMNDCDADTLTYSCICSNGLQPNVSEYSQTIPFYICQQANEDCAGNCPSSDNACVDNCRTSNPCGAQDPERINATSSSSAASATGTSGAEETGASETGAEATETAAGTGFVDTPAATSDSAASKNMVVGVWTLRSAERYSLAMVFAGIFAGFAIFL